MSGGKGIDVEKDKQERNGGGGGGGGLWCRQALYSVSVFKLHKNVQIRKQHVHCVFKVHKNV